MLVERIDQGDEARSFVALVPRHHRDADDDDGVETPGDRQIIGGSTRLADQALEREDGNALETLGDVELAPSSNVEIFSRNLGAVLDRIIGQFEEGLAQGLRRL